MGSLGKLAGGTNVYGDGDGQEFLFANSEDMISKEPDVILRAAHGLPDRGERAGLELVGVGERVGDGSQRDACLVGDILDSDFSHGGPCAEARGGLDVSSRAV